MFCNRFISLFFFLLVQTFTFAQGGSIDSVQVVYMLADSVVDNIVCDTIKFTTTFETIKCKGNKYYALRNDTLPTEITWQINGQKRVLITDKDGNVMGVEEYKKCGISAKILSHHNAHRDSTMATNANITFSKIPTENYGFDYWRGNDYDKAEYPSFNGYTILDMGDFNNKGFSVFYAMEKSVIFK